MTHGEETELQSRIVPACTQQIQRSFHEAFGTCGVLWAVAGWWAPPWQVIFSRSVYLPKPYNLFTLILMLVQLHNLITVKEYCILEIKITKREF